MVLSKQNSRIDWGDSMLNLTSSLKSSLTWNKNLVGGSGATGATGGTGGAGGSGMASAAAAAALSYERGPSFGSDPYAPNIESDREESDSDAERGALEEKEETAGETKGARGSCRRASMIVATVGIVVGASVGIGSLVINGNGDLNERPSSVASERANPPAGPEQQRLLETAERVVLACGEGQLTEDLSGCQELCHEHMCCVNEGEYSCEDDPEKDCPVYAGCRGLIEGGPAVSESDSVRNRTKWGRA